MYNFKKLCFSFFAVLILFFAESCSVIASFSGEEEEESIILSFDKNKTSMLIGEMEIINLTASDKQNSASIGWEYDHDMFYASTDNYSCVLTALKSGSGTVTARCGSNSVSCIVTVSSETYSAIVTNPYVYASSDYIDVRPGSTVKISGSLFGGNSSDIDGYSWSIDKPSVADLSTEGNYCWITGKTEGMAKVTVRHSKAAYPYSILVNCSSDGTNIAYITTSDNIITMNMSENDTADFSVDLKNPLITDYASGFVFDTVDELGNTLFNAPVNIENAGNLTVTLRALREGTCLIRVSHPSALYSIDILVRVIANAETGYISPSDTILMVSGTEPSRLSMSLTDFSGFEDKSSFTWTFSDGADEYISWEILNGDGSDSFSGNEAVITGKKTGSVKITVNYPGLSPRVVVVLVRNIITEAADTKTYITTSQNYIRMKENDPECLINAVLVNCKAGDGTNIKWNIKNCPADGSNGNVINWKQGSGSAISSVSSSRAIIGDYSETVYAVIEPVRQGTAYIEVSHPRAVYKTIITVTVSQADISEDKTILSVVSSPCLKLMNGQTETLSVAVSSGGNPDEILWQVKEGGVTIVASGTNCSVTAPEIGTGITNNIITASYPSSGSVITFSVATYDTTEELESLIIPCLYTEFNQVNLKTGQNTIFYINTVDISDFQNILWQVISGTDVVALETTAENTAGSVVALKSGTAQIKVSYPGCDDLFFSVVVSDVAVVDTEQDCYLSTTNNVVYFDNIGEKKELCVTPFNISESAWGDISWECSNTLFEIACNGASCTITSLSADAEAILTVKHPVSLNELVINLKSGSRYVYVNEDIPYITTSIDVIELYEGQEEFSLYATLNHTEESEPENIIKGFSFTSSDESIASVSYISFSNSCLVKPVKNGTCKITVTHPDSGFEKDVVVVVKHAMDATSVPYITTEQNVITIVQGDYATATAKLVNSQSINSKDWNWKPANDSDARIASVIANNGTSAMISANNPGIARIKVTHSEAPYALDITVVVLDSAVVTLKPYISVSETIINLTKGGSSTITAEMVGGNTGLDQNYFKFYSSNSSIVLVSSSSGVAYIRGVSAGMAYVTVSNARYTDSYSRTILVVVEDTNEDGVYIKPSQSILKLKPDESGTTVISAELVNGAATDGQDFVWWCDDYSLLGITAVADRCSVQCLGKSGTTKIHVKHAKAAKQCDILVLVSKYTTFAFSQESATVSSEKLYFFPMQVPALESGYKVRYASSNPEICLVEGSDAVAWVCGLDNGTVSLTASLIGDDDKTVLATAEMLVTVTVPEVDVPVISVGNSIVTVEKGTSRTFAAIISGEGIEDTEKYNLKWSIKDGKDGISFLNESAGKTAFGSDCYMTFDEADDYVIAVTHERTGAETDIYIIVEDKGVVDFEGLSSSLESIYKDEGSFTLTATLINATEADYKNIEWSAVKVGGQSIVAVSKAKGQNCTVTPKNIGQTSVIARLPNGKSAKCIVVVKANAEIILDLGTVRVNPGYTEVVNYKTNPQNATINWYSQMTTSASSMDSSITNYFKIEDDTVNKQLRITGLKDFPGGAAGTVTATMVGASSANLPKITVYVEYNLELEILDANMNTKTNIKNTRPDTLNTEKFFIKYFPADLDIDISMKVASEETRLLCSPADGGARHPSSDKCPDNLIEIKSVNKSVVKEGSNEKGLMEVIIAPHNEGYGTLKFVGTLPGDDSGTYAKKQEISYSAYYEAGYTFSIDMSMTPSGAFSNFEQTGSESGTLNLSDGEEVIFTVKIREENARGQITGLSWDSGNAAFKSSDDYEKISDWNNKGRNTLAKNLWNVNDSKEVGDGSCGLRNGRSLISFKADELSDGTKVWHLKHNWDFYKDIADEYQGDNWEETYKNNRFNRSFFEALRDGGVDNFLVYYEPIYRYNGKKYYLHPHGSDSTAVVTWSSWQSGMRTDRCGCWFCNDPDINWCDGYTRARITVNGVTKDIFSFDYGGKYNWRGQDYRDVNYSASVSYIKCIPYTVTLDELKNNNFFCTPNGDVNPLWTWSDDGREWGEHREQKHYNYFTSANLTTQKGNMVVVPTVTKYSFPIENGFGVGTGTILVLYTDGYGIPHGDGRDGKPLAGNITVNVKKRICEAYQSDKWKISDNNHYTFIGEYQFTEAEYGLFVDTNNISIDSTVEKKFLDYSIFPSSSTVTIEFPKDNSNYPPLVANGTLVENSASKTVWEIHSHNSISDLGEGQGQIELVPQGPYYKKFKVRGWNPEHNRNDEYEIQLQVNYVPNWKPRITYYAPTIYDGGSYNFGTSPSHSGYKDGTNNFIYVGDGDKVTFTFSDTKYAYWKFKDSKYFSVLDDRVQTRKYKVSDSEYKTEEFVNPVYVYGNYDSANSWFDNAKGDANKMSIGNISFNGDKTEISITISHNTDYGYFAYNNKANWTLRSITNETYPSIDSIDEASLNYATVYNSDGKTVNQTATNENKMRAKRQRLHELRLSYANRTTWFGAGLYNGVSMSYGNRLVGVLQIILENDAGETVKLDYPVSCNKSHEPSCINSVYGYSVPESLYLSGNMDSNRY